MDQKILFSLLNQSKQLEKFILVNSEIPLKQMKFKIVDLKSRIESFLFMGIELPTDDLLQVIITKSFSDKQVKLDPKISNFIIKKPPTYIKYKLIIIASFRKSILHTLNNKIPMQARFRFF